MSSVTMQPDSISVVQRHRKESLMASVPTLGDLQMRHDPAGRGYHVVYREHEVNHCPGCGRTQWLIGRMSAECAFCATALPLAEASMRHHNPPIVIQHRNRVLETAYAA
jgi:hypothetical protein